MYPWDNHLSPRGHAAAAEALAGVLAPWIHTSGATPGAPSASGKLVPGIGPSREQAPHPLEGAFLHDAPGTGIESPPGRVTAAGRRRAMPATTEAGS